MTSAAALRFYETDLFIPAYKSVVRGDWSLRVAELASAVGYWSDSCLVRDMAGLLRREADGRVSTWMTMTPMEIESQEIGCRLARGDTVVMGMGMGWCAANAALRPEVTGVTVVERDPLVIEMNEVCAVFDQLPEAARAKIRVVQADALEYRHPSPADTLLADIWLPLNGDDRVEQVRTMRANTRAARVYYWGQEMTIARRARDTGRPLDDATVAAVAAGLDLGLLGPEWPGYAALTARAAARWLRD